MLIIQVLEFLLPAGDFFWRRVLIQQQLRPFVNGLRRREKRLQPQGSRESSHVVVARVTSRLRLNAL